MSGYETETVLAVLVDNLNLKIDKGHTSLLFLLDLSASGFYYSRPCYFVDMLEGRRKFQRCNLD